MNTLLSFNDGHAMPQLGLGLMRFGSEDETQQVLDRAIAAGYRLFDTAAVYGNEEQTGAGLAGYADMRDALFITTKLWNDSQVGDAPLEAFAASRLRLGLDYIDLYLVHWPTPAHDTYLNAWQKLIALRETGRVRSIGVSNFTPEHLERLIRETGVVPAVNQVEMHPYFQQRELRAFHAAHGIITQAWSPFGGGGTGAASIFSDPVIQRIAEKHQRTPSQVVLRWHIEAGVSVIPKATSDLHLQQNLAACGFALDAQDIADLDALDRPDGRHGPDPLSMNMRSF